MKISLHYCDSCGRAQQAPLPTPHAVPGTRGHVRCPGEGKFAVFHREDTGPIPPLVGIALAADMLGVSKASGIQLLRQRGRMPEPQAGPPDVSVPVYRRSDIERLADELARERTEEVA